MPEWLAAVLTAAGVSVAGQALAYVIVVNVLGVRINAHDREIHDLKKSKVDLNLHESEVRRIDGRLTAADSGIQSAGHRMNGLDMRITSLHQPNNHPKD